MVLQGFVYTIAVDIYAFRLAFSRIQHCVQRQNTLRFAPKYLAFCTKIPCVLQQNALHLAPKRTAFSIKTHYILLQMALKWVQMAVCLNKNSFYCMHMLPLFASKTTFARIAFLGQGERLVDRKGTHNVKFLAENQTKDNCAHACVRAKVRKTFTLPLPVRAVAGHVALSQRRRYHENAEVIYHRQPSFQLVENAKNDFCLVASFRNNHVLRQTNGGRISVFIMSFLYNNRKVFCLHGLVNRDFYVNLSRTSYMKRALLSAFATQIIKETWNYVSNR